MIDADRVHAVVKPWAEDLGVNIRLETPPQQSVLDANVFTYNWVLDVHNDIVDLDDSRDITPFFDRGPEWGRESLMTDTLLVPDTDYTLVVVLKSIGPDQTEWENEDGDYDDRCASASIEVRVVDKKLTGAELVELANETSDNELKAFIREQLSSITEVLASDLMVGDQGDKMAAMSMLLLEASRDARDEAERFGKEVAVKPRKDTQLKHSAAIDYETLAQAAEQRRGDQRIQAEMHRAMIEYAAGLPMAPVQTRTTTVTADIRPGSVRIMDDIQPMREATPEERQRMYDAYITNPRRG